MASGGLSYQKTSKDFSGRLALFFPTTEDVACLVFLENNSQIDLRMYLMSTWPKDY